MDDFEHYLLCEHLLACLLARSSFNEENKGKHFSWRQRAKGVPRWQLARTTNSERICVPMWNMKIKRLLIKSFKHGNYTFMEKRITFHRMAMLNILLWQETPLYTLYFADVHEGQCFYQPFFHSLGCFALQESNQLLTKMFLSREQNPLTIIWCVSFITTKKEIRSGKGQAFYQSLLICWAVCSKPHFQAKGHVPSPASLAALKGAGDT